MARRTKQDAVETRERILEQAAIFFEEKGYNDTTLDDIAAALSLTKGAIFYHFKSKKALFTHIWTNLQKQMDTDIRRTAAKTAAESEDPFAGMMAGSKVQVGYLKQKRFSKIVMIEGPTVLGMDEWIKRDVALSRPRVGKAAKYLAERGLLKTKDEDSFTLLFIGMLSYSVLAMKSDENPQHIIDSFELILRGLPNSVGR